jgi:hypothetical protein
MPEMPQAVELARLVELEAEWENLPHASTKSTRELLAKQLAYEAYRSRRAAHDGRYRVQSPWRPERQRSPEWPGGFSRLAPGLRASPPPFRPKWLCQLPEGAFR